MRALPDIPSPNEVDIGRRGAMLALLSQASHHAVGEVLSRRGPPESLKIAAADGPGDSSINTLTKARKPLCPWEQNDHSHDSSWLNSSALYSCRQCVELWLWRRRGITSAPHGTPMPRRVVPRRRTPSARRPKAGFRIPRARAIEKAGGAGRKSGPKLPERSHRRSRKIQTARRNLRSGQRAIFSNEPIAAPLRTPPRRGDRGGIALNQVGAWKSCEAAWRAGAAPCRRAGGRA